MDQEHIDLVVQARAGDQNSFAALYNLYYKKVYASICTLIENRKDAEDITQDTFLRAWMNIQTISNPASFNAWLQRIASNLCYRHLHKQSIRILFDANYETEEDDMINAQPEPAEEFIPSVYVERDDLRSRLNEIIAKLLPAQKQTLSLYYFDGLKTEEIAQVMDCSANTVKTRLRLARKTIQMEIIEWERKTDERFTGAWGTVLLPLGEAIVPFFQGNTMSTAAASTILSNILGQISQISPEALPEAPQPPNAVHPWNASHVAVAAHKGLHPLVKLLLAFLALAVVGSGVYLAVRQPGDSQPAAVVETTQAPLDEDEKATGNGQPQAMKTPAKAGPAGAAPAQSTQSAQDYIQWSNPAFEQAVRAYMGIPEAPIAVSTAAAIKELDLSFAAGNVSLSDAAHFPQLENLVLHAGGYALNLSPLAQLGKLAGLHVMDAQVPELTPLSGLPALKWLSLTNVRISGIQSISSLTGLNFLYLSGIAPFDLSLLSGMTALENLQISDTEVSDLTPLAGLTALRWLCLMNTSVSDLSPLAGLPALNWLDVSYTQVTDLSPMTRQVSAPLILTDGLTLEPDAAPAGGQ